MHYFFAGGNDESLVLGGYGRFPLVLGHPRGGLCKWKSSSAFTIDSQKQMWEPSPLRWICSPKEKVGQKDEEATLGKAYNWRKVKEASG